MEEGLGETLSFRENWEAGLLLGQAPVAVDPKQGSHTGWGGAQQLRTLQVRATRRRL